MGATPLDSNGSRHHHTPLDSNGSRHHHTVRDMKGRNGRFTLLLHAMHAQHQKATPCALCGVRVNGTVSKHTEYEYPSARDDA